VKSGAFDYLVKPLDARSIVSRVRGAVATFARHDGGTGGNIALSMDFPGQVF
jgi:DNA-binding response OmpR family regulator